MKTKFCSACTIEKPLTDFRKDKSRVDGYRYDCKSCGRKRYQVHYTSHGHYYRDRAKKKYATNRIAIDDIKRASGCRCCAESEPLCLEFHHLDPTKKDLQIAGNMLASITTLLIEIQKCVVLCSNCHKKVHGGLITL